MKPDRPVPDGPPTAPTPRRFAIGDLMIVVGLVACSTAWFAGSVVPIRIANYARESPGIVRHLYFEGPKPPTFSTSSEAAIRGYLLRTPATILVEVGLPLLVLSTPAAVLFRIRKPRPPRGEALRQPGAAACLAALAAALLEVDLRWLGVPVPTPPPLNIGLAVAAAWVALGLSRRWRAEPGWVDRLGRAVGASWIAVGLATLFEDLVLPG